MIVTPTRHHQSIFARALNNQQTTNGTNEKSHEIMPNNSAKYLASGPQSSTIFKTVDITDGIDY